jgi:hypothetical protein
LPAYLERQKEGRLVGGEVGEPQRISEAIVKCDKALARASAAPVASTHAKEADK